jgi:hypothetical protein
LQAKEWVEHIGFLKYVLMHPHLLWHGIHTLLRTCLVHQVIPHVYMLIHKNQMNLMLVWYHYCFYAWFDVVVAYDMFVGLLKALVWFWIIDET